jgi:hypothetical protein
VLELARAIDLGLDLLDGRSRELSVHRHGLIERRLRLELRPERSQKVAALLKRPYGIAPDRVLGRVGARFAASP